ncbi:MAG: sulfotransferase [Proteobacteria bacterium]|nr:sulfotransferase [Pseudomonadota bacterium]
MTVGRNDPCPCGSGRKFKHCCGGAARAAADPSRSPSDVGRAWALLQSGRAAEAERACRELLAGHPDLGPAYACLGLAERALGRDGVAALESAARLLPADAPLQHALAQALEDRGELERAARHYGQAVALQPAFVEAHSDLGNLLLRLGRVDEAIASCRWALALRPEHAPALGNLGNAERARGNVAGAIELYRRLIALAPGLAQAHQLLGDTLLETGQSQAAVVALREAWRLAPGDGRGVARLARALAASGAAEEALSTCTEALHRAPSSDVFAARGTILSSLGRYEAAAADLRRAADAGHGGAAMYSNFAHALHCLGDYRAAIGAARRSLELEPRLAEAHLHLGNALLALSEVHAAEAAYRAGLAANPSHAALHTAEAMALRALGRLPEAEVSARRALEARPDAADTLALLGNLAGDRGRFDEATAQLEQALALDAELPEALIGLTRVRRMSHADESWRATAERLLTRGLPVAHAANLEHALGKFCDDVGDYEAAFEHHRAGNELSRRAGLRYDRDATTRRVSAILASYAPDALRELRSAGTASERPVFIVGMPRSGTTLAEQILASHAAVHGAGELLYWNFAADVAAGSAPAARLETIGRLGRQYLAELADRSAGALRVVDKLPSNFENLGLIHAALPGARVIHLERDPLDTCLSIYFQGFSTAHAYATDLGDLAHYYGEYRRLMAHWRAALAPGTLLEVPYEGLVDDTEGWSRRMLEHLGLPWDPRCLDFHRTDRPVLTASSWQVRQPIGRGSVGRWRHYERQLAPLRAALGR